MRACRAKVAEIVEYITDEICSACASEKVKIEN
jgi:hypothetical protein